MKYNIVKDIQIVCKILDISFSELANEIGVSRSTVTRIVKNETYPNAAFLEAFYSFIYENKKHPIKINKLKIEFAIDKYDSILFHGAKDEIDGPIDLNHSRNDIDLGKGFYLGEGYEQASSYVFLNKKSSIYLFNASKLKGLKVKEYSVSMEWMLLVSYYRGVLSSFSNSKLIKELVSTCEKYDVIIAPIADNDMYETMNKFARGEITDLQAISSLSASSLGKQHVLKSKRACECLEMVDRLYLCSQERKDIQKVREENALLSTHKSKIAMIENRRKGKYIEEILND